MAMSTVLIFGMRRKAERARRLREVWRIKPFDRVHESKKRYNRQQLKQELRRELAECTQEVS